MSIHIHTHIHAYAHTYIHRLGIHLLSFRRACPYTYTRIYMHMHIHTFTDWASTCLASGEHVHAYTHKQTYMCTLTHSQTGIRLGIHLLSFRRESNWEPRGLVLFYTELTWVCAINASQMCHKWWGMKAAESVDCCVGWRRHVFMSVTFGFESRVTATRIYVCYVWFRVTSDGDMYLCLLRLVSSHEWRRHVFMSVTFGFESRVTAICIYVYYVWFRVTSDGDMYLCLLRMHIYIYAYAYAYAYV